MRQIFPTGAYVRRTGDTMTGALTIKRDATSKTDGSLVVQPATATGEYLPIVFQDEAGIVKAVIRGTRFGDIFLSPSGRRFIQFPGNDISGAVNWYPLGFPGPIRVRRVMMVESRLFGRR